MCIGFSGLDPAGLNFEFDSCRHSSALCRLHQSDASFVDVGRRGGSRPVHVLRGLGEPDHDKASRYTGGKLVDPVGPPFRLSKPVEDIGVDKVDKRTEPPEWRIVVAPFH